MKDIKIDGIKPVRNLGKIKKVKNVKLFKPLANDRGATSVLVVFMMIVLVTLGAFSITSARANISFAIKANDWDEVYYKLDSLAEEFARDVDSKLIMAEDKVIHYIENREYEFLMHDEIPNDMQTKFNTNINLIAKGETIPEEVVAANDPFAFDFDMDFDIDFDMDFEIDDDLGLDFDSSIDDMFVFGDDDTSGLDDMFVFEDNDDFVFVENDVNSAENELVYVEVEQDGEIVLVEETSSSTANANTSSNSGIIVITIEDDGVDETPELPSITQNSDEVELTQEEKDLEIQNIIAEILGQDSSEEDSEENLSSNITSNSSDILDEIKIDTGTNLEIDNKYQDEFVRYLNVMADQLYEYYAQTYLEDLETEYHEIAINMSSVPNISYTMKYEEDEKIGFFVELEINDILCEFDADCKVSEDLSGTRFKIHTWREWQNVEPPANSQSVWDGTFGSGDSVNPFGTTDVDIFGN